LLSPPYAAFIPNLCIPLFYGLPWQLSRESYSSHSTLPSTPINWPLILCPPGLAKNSIVAAMSSG